MAAGKSVFYTDLPDSEVCILLFGLFFNPGRSIVWDWVVYGRLVQGFPRGVRGHGGGIVELIQV